MPKYQYTVSFHTQIVIVDTSMEDIALALEEANVKSSDIDAVSDWLLDLLNDDPEAHNFLEPPEVDSVWQGKEIKAPAEGGPD